MLTARRAGKLRTSDAVATATSVGGGSGGGRTRCRICRTLPIARGQTQSFPAGGRCLRVITAARAVVAVVLLAHFGSARSTAIAVRSQRLAGNAKRETRSKTQNRLRSSIKRAHERSQTGSHSDSVCCRRCPVKAQREATSRWRRGRNRLRWPRQTSRTFFHVSKAQRQPPQTSSRELP